MAFLKNLKYLTLGDPEWYKPITKIFEVQYLENGVR